MALPIEKIREAVYEKYRDNPRLTHILGVVRLAKSLAIKYGIDSNKMEVAALLHDYCKYESIEEMQRIIAEPVISEKCRDAPQIYHAYASSVVANQVFKITDEEILNAIKYHVYGRLGMGMFEKILVIADYCEDSREYSSCKKVRQILDAGNFDLAMYYCLKYTIEAVIAKGNKPMDEQYIILKELENNI